MADLRSWLSCIGLVVSAVAAHGCGRFGYDTAGDACPASDSDPPEYHRLEGEHGLRVGAMGVGQDPAAFAGATR